MIGFATSRHFSFRQYGNKNLGLVHVGGFNFSWVPWDPCFECRTQRFSFALKALFWRLLLVSCSLAHDANTLWTAVFSNSSQVHLRHGLLSSRIPHKFVWTLHRQCLADFHLRKGTHSGGHENSQTHKQKPIAMALQQFKHFPEYMVFTQLSVTCGIKKGGPSPCNSGRIGIFARALTTSLLSLIVTTTGWGVQAGISPYLGQPCSTFPTLVSAAVEQQGSQAPTWKGLVRV